MRTNGTDLPSVLHDVNDAMTMTAVEADGARDAPLERVGRLFDRQHRRIYRLARRMTRDPEEARDLLQETFLRAAARAESLPAEEAAAEAWLVRTTVNLCRDRGRRLTVRKRDRHKIDRPTRSRDDPEAATVARASVETALARLAPKRRAVIVLVELEELSTREVAGLLGIAEATVRWHLSKGRKELRTVLERELAHPSIRRPREGDDPR